MRKVIHLSKVMSSIEVDLMVFYTTIIIGTFIYFVGICECINAIIGLITR